MVAPARLNRRGRGGGRAARGGGAAVGQGGAPLATEDAHDRARRSGNTRAGRAERDRRAASQRPGRARALGQPGRSGSSSSSSNTLAEQSALRIQIVFQAGL
eukprot:940728-Prymnesium_polylepis.1